MITFVDVFGETGPRWIMLKVKVRLVLFYALIGPNATSYIL